MLDMEMGNQEYRLTETSPGVYSRRPRRRSSWSGTGGSSFQVTPKGGRPFTVLVVDRAAG